MNLAAQTELISGIIYTSELIENVCKQSRGGNGLRKLANSRIRLGNHRIFLEILHIPCFFVGVQFRNSTREYGRCWFFFGLLFACVYSNGPVKMKKIILHEKHISRQKTVRQSRCLYVIRKECFLRVRITLPVIWNKW